MPLGVFRVNSLAKYAPSTRTAVTITAYGNAQIDTAESKFGGASLLLDGTDDYLKIVSPNGSTDFDVTTSARTFEAWVYTDNINDSLKTIFTNRTYGATTVGWRLGMSDSDGTDGEIQLVVWDSSFNATVVYSTNTLSNNTWHHVAYVWDGIDNHSIYIDGVLGINYTDSTVAASEGDFFIGDETGGSGREWTSHIDEIRISNTARYTANFTPSTTPFVNDESTLLLLHMDGTDGSTHFEDDNGVRTKIGLNGEVGAKIGTVQSKFGGSAYQSGYTGDRGNGRRLKVQNKDIWTLDGDFTVECWAYVDEDFGSTATSVWNHREFTGGAGLGLGCGGSINNWIVSDADVGTLITSLSNWSLDTWYHLAVTRSGSTIEFFVDGVSQGTATYSYEHTQNITIGNIEYTTVLGFPGLIDEFRVSDIARYTTTFTPSTTAFTNDANTLLLLHMDGTDGSTDFIDDNS